jgi:hypothetical protein
VYVDGCQYWHDFVAEYAEYLMSQNRDEDARMLYYDYLRTQTTFVHPDEKQDFHREPFPIGVFFDPEPDFEVWEYSRDRLRVAIKLARAIKDDRVQKTVMREARSLAPTWYLPVAYMAFEDRGKIDEALYAQALSLTTRAVEREWLRLAYLYFMTDGLDRRENPNFPKMIDAHVFRRRSAFLESNKFVLKQNYLRISAGHEPGKFYEFPGW